MLGAIDSQYGNEAFYVHLKRNKAEVVKSWNERWNYSFSNIRAFTEGVLSNVPELLTDAEKQIIGEMHYDVVNANIELFLRDKSNILTVRLEEIESDFPRFWEAIGAEGDFNAAMAEFKVKHNHTESKDVVEKKERSFRMDIQQKILLKQLREGGTLAQTISWRMQLFILKVKLLTA
jgi:hypothetical protein